MSVGERETKPAVAFEPAACALCGSRDGKVVFNGLSEARFGLPGKFNVVRCRDCRLVRTTPRPTEATIGHYYPAPYSRYAQESPSAGRLAGVRRVFATPHRLRHGTRPELPRNGSNRALDVGAGTGGALARLIRDGWDAYGIEPSEAASAQAAELHQIPANRIFAGRVEDAPFEARSFDFIRMSHSLEHVHDPRAVLDRVATWLRVGGRLRILVPNFDSLERKVFRARWAGLDVPRHLYHFDPATLAQLLQLCGLRITRTAPQFQGITLAASVQFTVDHLRRRPPAPLRRGPLYYATLPAAWLASAVGRGACLDIEATHASSPVSGADASAVGVAELGR